MFSNVCEVKAVVPPTGEKLAEVSWILNTAMKVEYGGSNCTTPVEYEFGPSGEVSQYFYYNSSLSYLMNTSTDYYAYRVVINPASYNYTIKKGVLWNRPMVGTYDDIQNVRGPMGYWLQKGNDQSIWYVNDYAEQELRIALISYCNVLSSTSVNTYAEQSVTGSVNVKVYGYTRAGYEQAVIRELEEGNDLQKEQNETSKGILTSITDFFGSFFQNLIDSVISVFVPSSEEMSDLFDQLNQFFSDTFGFLYYPFEFLIEAFNIFLNSDSETGITFPAFSIMGYEVWGNQTYDISSDELAGTVFQYVRIGTGALLSMAFVDYLRRFFDKRFGGGGQ